MTEQSRINPLPVRLQKILAQYFKAVDDGSAPERDAFIDSHPEAADELRAYFADTDREAALLTPTIGGADDSGSQSLGADDSRSKSLSNTVDFEPGEIRRRPTASPPRDFGDYEVIEEIARGGMGVVYKAHQTKLKRDVALKLILAGCLASTDDLKRFRAEAKASAHLDHPNIVPIYEIGEFDGQQYYSMKLIKGGNLAHHLERLRAEPRTAVPLLAAVARGIHYAHQRGILHRDLKPANILLDESGVAHVTDFGLAMRITGDSRVTQSGAIVGTPAYMSPEQAKGNKNLTTAADVYSVGAILYEMLTGQPPFRADSPLDTLLQVIEKAPVPPRQINPTVNRDLETICLKCLEKEPHRRYGSAEALAEDLDRWINGEPITARPVGSFERVWRWSLRNPVTAGLLGTVALFVVSTAVGATIAAFTIAEARDKAVASETKERIAHAETEAARQEVEVNNDRTRGLVGRFYTSKGASLAKQGDVLGALTWFGEALKEDAGGEEREEMYRWRLDAFLKRAPRPMHVWHHPTFVSSARFVENGRKVLSTSFRNVRTPKGVSAVTETQLVDVATGRIVERSEAQGSGTATSVVSPDARLKLSFTAEGGGTALEVVDLATGKPLFPRFVVEFPSEEGIGETGGTDRMPHGLFSPDGSRFLVSFNRMLKKFQSGRNANAGVYEGFGQIFETATGKPVSTRMRHHDSIDTAFYSVDGSKLFTGSEHQLESGSSDYEYFLWDVKSGRQVLTQRHAGAAVGPSLLKSVGNRLLAGTLFYPDIADRNRVETEFRLWDTASGAALGQPIRFKGQALVRNFTKDATRALWASSEQYAALPNGSVTVLDCATGKPAYPPIRHEDATLQTAIISADDARLITVGNRKLTVSKSVGRLQAWDLRTGRALSQLLKFDDPISQLISSPDGKRVLGVITRSFPDGRSEATVMNWDESLHEAAPPVRHEGQVSSLRFAADGKRYYTIANRRETNGRSFSTVRFWDVASGQASSAPMTVEGQINAATISPDERILLTIGRDAGRGRDGELMLWEVATGKLAAPIVGHRAPVQFAAFSPDGRTLLTTGRDRSVMLWDVFPKPAAQPLYELPEIVALDSLSRDRRSSTSPGGDSPGAQPDRSATGDPAAGGRRLLTVSGDAAQVWDTVNRKAITPPLPHSRTCGLPGFTADGRRLATITGETKDVLPLHGTGCLVQIWDVDSAKPLGKPLAHGDGVALCKFSPDGTFLATAVNRIRRGNDNDAVKRPPEECEARVYNVVEGRLAYPPLVHPTGVSAVLFTPDGRTLLTHCMIRSTTSTTEPSKNRLLVLDVATGKPRYEPLDETMPSSFSPDGRLMFIGDTQTNTLKVMELQTGRLAVAPIANAANVVYAPDGRTFVTIGGGEARLWIAATLQALDPPLTSSAGVQQAKFSPDGTLILTLSGSAVQTWDVANRRPLGALMRHDDQVTAAEFSADGRRILTTAGGYAQLWSAVAGQPLGPPTAVGAGPQSTGVLKTAFSADGRHVVARQGTLAQVWDLGYDRRPVKDLHALTEALGGLRVDASDSLLPLPEGEFRTAWTTAKERFPAEFPSTPEEGADWHRRQVAESVRTRDWHAAVVHLDALIGAGPNSGDLLNRRGEAHAALKHWDKAIADFDKAVASLNEWTPWFNRGVAHAELGRWEQASNDFGKARGYADAPVRAWYHHARIRLHLGDLAGYRDDCTKLLDKYGLVYENPTYEIAKVCVLAPDSLVNLKEVTALADFYGWPVPAYVYCRCGRFDDALKKLQEGFAGTNYIPIEFHNLFLAMTHQHFGRADVAASWYQRASQAIDRGDNASLPWDQRLDVNMLRREVEALLKKK